MQYKSAAQSEKRKEDICERGTRSNPPTGGDDSGFTMNFEFNSLSRSGVLCGNEFIRYRPFQDSPEEIITEESGFSWGRLEGMYLPVWLLLDVWRGLQHTERP